MRLLLRNKFYLYYNILPSQCAIWTLAQGQRAAISQKRT